MSSIGAETPKLKKQKMVSMSTIEVRGDMFTAVQSRCVVRRGGQLIAEQKGRGQKQYREIQSENTSAVKGSNTT